MVFKSNEQSNLFGTSSILSKMYFSYIVFNGECVKNRDKISNSSKICGLHDGMRVTICFVLLSEDTEHANLVVTRLLAISETGIT